MLRLKSKYLVAVKPEYLSDFQKISNRDLRFQTHIPVNSVISCGSTFIYSFPSHLSACMASNIPLAMIHFS
jgi:hypothetical protein